MPVHLSTPAVEELPGLLAALRAWQDDEVPVQLHPGDIGWFARAGAVATAAALRVWRRAGDPVALGLLDGAGLVRWTVAPGARHDPAVADQVVADLAAADRGVLRPGAAAVEAPPGTLLHDRLLEVGWLVGEGWTPLRRDLTGPVEPAGVPVRVVRVDGAVGLSAYTAVHRAAFASPRLTGEAYGVMAGGPAYAGARSLLVLSAGDAGDAGDVPVAEVTVWSAGPGRPGLLEPMGVHPSHRGRGYGRAACLAAAAALRELGSSCALVCTPSANVGAIATYRAAGFSALPERFDRTRPDVL